MNDIKSTVITTVATFSDMEKAREVKNVLEQAGIHAEVNDESTLQKFWFLSKPLAADKVVVEEKDFERAREILKGADAKNHVLCGEVRCPKCGSADVQYPQFTRKFIMTNFVEVLCFLHLLDKEFFCLKCQNSWPVSVTLRRETDVLNWPKKHNGLVKKEQG